MTTPKNKRRTKIRHPERSARQTSRRVRPSLWRKGSRFFGLRPQNDVHRLGTVYLVGAGPGDPGLLTLRGAELLQKADAVVYDGLVNPALLAWASCPEKIFVGKNISHGAKQDEINRLLVRLARQGKSVVRLKGGDPFIFGRGGEEASHLKEKKIRFEIVPGITAGYGAPAYAGIPVTDRRLASQVTFVTAHESSGKKNAPVNWKKLAQMEGTLVSFMGVQTLPMVAKSLIAGGKSPATRVSVIEWGTLPRQRVIQGSLRDIAQKTRAAKIGSPAVIVVGEVNRFAKKLAWFGAGSNGRKGPLTGKTVLVTRAQSQAGSLKSALENEGARVLEFPVVEILPPKDWAPLDRALNNANAFDWIMFTSVNAVHSVFGRLETFRKDARIFAHPKIAAIGEITQQALAEKGIFADLVAGQFTSHGLFQALKEQNQIHGKNFLLPRADIAPEDFPQSLEKAGGKVTQAAAYQTVPVRDAAKKKKLDGWLGREKIDFITFTSSSAVRNFFEIASVKALSKMKTKFVSIGPVTSSMLREYGRKPYREARRHTIPGLVEVMTHER